MPAEKRCPRCGSIIPLLANACMRCHPQGHAGPPVEDQRFSVMRSGQQLKPVAAQPTRAPADVTSIHPGQRVWYCRIGGQTIGPVTSIDIRDAFSKGQIDGHASVGIQGKKDWFLIRALPQFSDLVTGIGPAPGPPGNPVRGGGLPPPASPQRTPAPVSIPAPAGRPSRASHRPLAAAPARASAAPFAAQPQLGPGFLLPPRPTNAARDDETMVVPPLPIPTGTAPAAAPAAGKATNELSFWQEEARRHRRLNVVLGILAGGLFVLSAALLGLLVSR